MRSSTRLYNQYKLNCGVALLAAFSWVAAEFLLNDGWENWPKMVLFGLIALAACAYAGMIFGSLTEVEIDSNQIRVLKNGISVPWTKVESIGYKWYFGLYKVTIEEGTFYFPPLKRSLFLFLADDEFDELIDRKKRHLQL